MDLPSIYQAILGWPCYAKFMVVPNYAYLKLKLPGPRGVIAVSGDLQQAHSYEEESLNIAMATSQALELQSIWATMIETAPKSSRRKQSAGAFKPTNDTNVVRIDLEDDIFAWKPSDMLGILRQVAEHSLDILPGAKPVKQCLYRFDDKRRKAIGEEITRLLATGFIKEVFHSEWIANPVQVQKKNGASRMCIDYTNLNKACPKVPYPLP
ncbi:uncharacterized protein [Miscanthus floridulus]|uniref:uncharacterized protein n=1 Tax=Miscanthus floridulus TaxID=154761 RepID=UPI00345AC67F